MPERSSAPNLDDALARLDAVGARIHAQRPADCTGNAVIEMEAANAVVMGKRCHTLVWRCRTRLDSGWRDGLGLAETFCRQPHDKARNTALAHQKIGTDTNDHHRDFFRHGLQESGEVFLVGRLEQRLGQAAGAEPGDLFHLGAGRDAPAQAGKAIAELCDERLASDHDPPPASSPGSA